MITCCEWWTIHTHTHTHTHSNTPSPLAPDHALTSPPACDITVPVASTVSSPDAWLLIYHTHTKCPPHKGPHWLRIPPTRSLMATRKCLKHGAGEQGPIKKDGGPLLCDVCAGKQSRSLASWLSARTKIHSSELRALCEVVMQPNQTHHVVFFGVCPTEFSAALDKQQYLGFHFLCFPATFPSHLFYAEAGTPSCHRHHPRPNLQHEGECASASTRGLGGRRGARSGCGRCVCSGGTGWTRWASWEPGTGPLVCPCERTQTSCLLSSSLR